MRTRELESDETDEIEVSYFYVGSNVVDDVGASLLPGRASTINGQKSMMYYQYRCRLGYQMVATT